MKIAYIFSDQILRIRREILAVLAIAALFIGMGGIVNHQAHAAGVNYNRSSAEVYASNWGGLWCNDDGIYYIGSTPTSCNQSSGPLGNPPDDCTHFISRALLAAGIDDGGIAYAPSLASWLVNNNMASLISESSTSSGPPTPPSNLQVGDIILYHWGRDNISWDHAAMVTQIQPQILVTEHSFQLTGETWNETNQPWDNYWGQPGAVAGPNTMYGFLLINASPNAQPVFSNAHVPVVGKDADGRLEVFEVAQDNQLWHDYEINTNGQWSGWHSMGGNWPDDPAVALNYNGTLEIFIVGNQGPNGGTLFHSWQTSAGSSTWTGWIPMNGIWPRGVPAVVHNLAHGNEVFMRGLDAKLYHSWQCGNCSSSGWSNWYPMEGTWNTDPVATNNSNGAMQVFMLGEDSNLYYNQESPSGSWSGWVNMGGPWVGKPAVTTNLANGLEVFIRGQDSSVYHAWQTGAGSSNWTSWQSLGGMWPRDPIVVKNADGRMELFAVGQTTWLYHQWEDSHGNWSGWVNIGGAWPGQPTARLNLVGGIEVFITGYSSEMYHAWQNGAGNSSYTGWYQLT